MENKTENDVRLTLRIYVEPVEVELNQEGAILITTLQSALPGAFGLYFYENDCRASLRFDGNKLLPPSGGWKNRKYYASLGCRSFDYPFGSYANATKQFERSVNSIQRLLANQKLFDNNFVKRDFTTSGRRKAAQQDSSLVHAKIENMQQLLTSTIKHNISERFGTTDNKQAPLEQQFVELARISTSKDSIIEQQHADIKIANEKLEQKERSMKSLQESLSKLMESCDVKEKELAFLRGLNQDQKFMHKKVNELENRLMDREKIIAAQKKEIEFLVRKVAILSIGQFPSQKLSNPSTSLGSANGTIVKAFESVKDDSDQNDKEAEYAKMTTEELVNVLARIKTRNEQLENELNVANEKYQQLSEIYIALMAENTKLIAQLVQEQEKATKIIMKKGSCSAVDMTAGDASKWTPEHLIALKQDLAVSEKRVAKLIYMINALTNSDDDELKSITQDDLFNPL